MLNFHDPGRLLSRSFYEDYEMPLAHAFYSINQRGVLVDAQRLDVLRKFILSELQSTCSNISTHFPGKGVIPSLPVKPSGKKTKQPPDTINLSSPDQIIDALKSLGIKPPKKRRAGGAYTESTNEESLNELFAETGHPALKDILRVRELNKLLGTYVNAQLEANILYGAYFVTGTVTGRRSCRENFLGLGNNHQNQPKHSDLGKKYRECLVARPGHIFINCDQVQAEDWIVQGTIVDNGGSDAGLQELLNGVDRHRKLASFIFSKPEDLCGKDTPERFMGKKTRHAGNYDMQAFRFACEMAKEGYIVSEQHCEFLLERFHAYDSGIRQIYHKWVQSQLNTTRTLTTPFGRVRQFLALRDFTDNRKVFKEGYAQNPQSTVGDNTGMTILWFETYHPGYVVMDGHDAVVLEVPDTINDITSAISWLQEGFDRIIRFPNGLKINIPTEVELGYDLKNMKKCADFSSTGLSHTRDLLNKPPSHLDTSISGVPLPQSQLHSNVTYG